MDFKNHPKDGTPPLPQAWIAETQDKAELRAREREINLAEQALLRQRIQLMSDFLNDLPASDPQYSALAIQIQMDKIEYDELRNRYFELGPYRT
jgi:hypothetical protein